MTVFNFQKARDFVEEQRIESRARLEQVEQLKEFVDALEASDISRIELDVKYALLYVDGKRIDLRPATSSAISGFIFRQLHDEYKEFVSKFPELKE